MVPTLSRAALFRWAGIFAVAGAIAISAVIALWGIGQAPVWGDETASLHFAHLSWTDMWKATRYVDAVFVLYYGLLHALTLGRVTLFEGRALSTLFALPTLPLVYLIGMRLFGQRVAIGATVLCSLNYLFLQEAREVRMYALLETVDTASWLAFLLALERRSTARLAGCTMIGIVSILIHPLAVANLGAEIVAAFLVVRERRTLISILSSIGLACVIGVGILVVTAHAAGTAQIFWIPKPSPRELWSAIADSSGGRLPAFLGIVILAVAAYRAIVRPARETTVVLSWLLVPPIILILFSYVNTPIFVNRYLIEVVPAAALLTAWLIAGISFRAVRIAVVALLAITTVIAVRKVHTFNKTDWPVIDRSLQARAKPGDVIAFSSIGLELSYQDERTYHLLTMPDLPIVYPTNVIPMTKGLQQDYPATIPRGYRRIWLIGRGPLADEAGVASLEPHYRLARVDAKATGLVLDCYLPR